MTDRPETLSLLVRLRIVVLRFLAVVFITLEKSVETFWPPFLWACVFACLWLLQIPQWFGKIAENGVAVIFITGFLVLLWRGLSLFHLPGHGEITRRIEQDNNLLHRPLSGLEDRLANPGRGETRRLWTVWQAKLQPALKSLRLPSPRPVLTRLTPYALRGMILCFLLISLVVAGGSWGTRLRHGMIPFTFKTGSAPSDNVVVWITPPPYTGQPQMVLKGFGHKDKPVPIPEGSIIKARVNGWVGTPELVFDHHSYPMQALGKGSYGLESAVESSQTLTIRQMKIPRLRWQIAYNTDLPPSIEQTGAPEIQAKGEMIIPLRVQDDYGVESLTTHIALDKAFDDGPLGAPFTETRNVMSPPRTAMDFKPEFDLAWHPWAGQPVVLTLEVKDHKGQVASLPGVKITLPESPFRHPVAKKLIALRKRLIWTPEAASRNVAHELESMMAHPDLYNQDITVFLALRAGASRLFYDGSRTAVADIVSLLWDTALRIEDGNFSLARRSLRDAQKTLQDALKDPATTPEEIATLMENLRTAMSEYMREMFRELQKQAAENGADLQMLSPDMVMQQFNPEDLAAFLDKMQAEALSGDRNAAREMLAQMERMMESLDPSSMQTGMPQDMKDMMETMSRMQALIEQQKTLLEETRARAGDINRAQSYSDPLPPNADLLNQWSLTDLPPSPQETRKGENAPRRDVDTTDSAAKQEDLRRVLGELMLSVGDKLGQIPGNMGNAEQAMRQSSSALGENNPGDSMPHQEAAIKFLSEGQQQMAQTLAQRMKQMMMFSFGPGRTDPLGRPMDDGEDGMPWSGSKVKIPDKAERRRVQDILEELRKKSGELQRPAYELDYYRRLMRQF